MVQLGREGSRERWLSGGGQDGMKNNCGYTGVSLDHGIQDGPGPLTHEKSKIILIAGLVPETCK